MELAGRTLTATFSDLTNQTNGSVLLRYGDTTVLATAVISKNQKNDLDYFPLIVEYEEKYYAAGRILGGRFQKREGRPSEDAVLSGRLVDRTIRPLFADYIRNEVQVVITVLSIDEDNDPDILGVIASSLALGTSDIPWNGPASAVRIGLLEKDGAFVVNSTYKEREITKLDLLLCGRAGQVSMIESEAKEIPEEKMEVAFELAVAEIEKIQSWQKGIIAEMGKPKRAILKPEMPKELSELFAAEVSPVLEGTVFAGTPGAESAYALRDVWVASVKEKLPTVNAVLAIKMFEDAVDQLLHDKGLKENKRQDNRAFDEVRPLFAQAGGLSNIVHGCGIFYRGGTHVLTTLTLGGPGDAQTMESIENIDGKKYFMHHYNFPPFSVGETGRLGGMNRRSIGHGALAEKSLRGILPAHDDFPYTIRLVSEVMASNGSSSMGSVCASTIAMMDGGIPITRPAAGIAMGLLLGEGGEYKVLTDIQGPEDHYGDMDFKVAGTREGVTGIQLDVKVEGVPVKILTEAMLAAKKARYHIIETIEQAIPAPREKMAQSAPSIVKAHVPVDKIGMIIGPGGKNIQKMCLDYTVQIDIEDDGTVFITGKQDGTTAAKAQIEGMTHEYKAGERFTGEVVRIMDFGAFVNIAPDQDGLVHVSEIAPFRVEKVTDYLKLGDKVPVIVKEVDEKGRLSLSIKQADANFIKNKSVPPPPAPTPTV